MNKLKLIFIFLATILVASGCNKKSNDEAPNVFIDKESGDYKIVSWTKQTYSSGQLVSEEKHTDIGTIKLNVVNFGFYSEGTYEKSVDVTSGILSYVNPNNNCYETFRWNGDESRISFSFGWCDIVNVFTLTLDGYKKKKQTWTYITTDAQGTMTGTEIFEVEKQ